ncbi:MAG: hypothetical protein RLZZ262_2668 [Bacteroidota bacterium]|jgi:glycosyltransferase involved in cell wall biosynthesis
MNHVTVLVSNDLQHDQRVHKVATTLSEMGFKIHLVGRQRKDSVPYTGPFSTTRFNLFFERGALFYAALQLRLFFYLLRARTDIIVANDLDTLLPAYLISKLRRKKLVYDSHEYFTEAEGLTGRPFQKAVWLAVERFIFPKLPFAITVNESIAKIYHELYGVTMHVVRNVPPLREHQETSKDRAQLGLPDNATIVLLQGSYIDPDRGGMELIEAFQYLPQVVLVVIGSGRDYSNMVNRSKELKLSNVIFKGRMPYHDLMQYTAVADIGVSLDKPLHLNYTLSLPNKLFDYIHAGIPVLVSDLPELRRIVDSYQVGMCVAQVEPKMIAETIQAMTSKEKQNFWRSNTQRAKIELNWQVESLVLARIYAPYLEK